VSGRAMMVNSSAGGRGICADIALKSESNNARRTTRRKLRGGMAGRVAPRYSRSIRCLAVAMRKVVAILRETGLSRLVKVQ